MICSICGKEMGQAAYPCPWCGQTYSGGPLPSQGLDRHREDQVYGEAKKVLDEADRLRSKRRAHAITGGITFLLLNLILGFPESFRVVSLVMNVLTSAFFGLPIGYLISRLGGGPYLGAAVSVGAFFGVRLVMGVPALLGGADFGSVAGWAAVTSLSGAAAGAIIGLHVKMDD